MRKEKLLTSPDITTITQSDLGLIRSGEKKWTKELSGQTETFEIVDWTDIPTLEEIVDLQQRVWGIRERDAVPCNLLAIAGDTGGFIIAARNQKHQIEGFVLVMGATDGSLVLHMIGIDSDSRYKKDLGFNLSTLLLLLAKEKGVTKIIWTYDPIRGSNARLNIEKLGAVVSKYTINKYGKVNSELYGEDPTDRFTVEWHLEDPSVIQRIKDIESGDYKPKNLHDVSHLPILEWPVDERNAPSSFLVEIPYDVNQLPKEKRAQWRIHLRNIFTSILDTSTANQKDIINNYQITGFATGQLTSDSEKRSYYIINRKKK